jgi:hypothetical protein
VDQRLDERVERTDDMTTPIPYVCVPGSPYTGSTLLGMLLDSHPACASIGAATGLTARVDLASYRCSCGARFTDCGFWARVARRTVELEHPVTIYRQDFWNTHVRLSHRRSINGVLVSSLGNTTLNSIRDAVVRRVGPVGRTIEAARAASWSLARAVLEETGKRVFVDTARYHQRPRHLAASPMLDVKVIHLVRDPRGNVSSIMRHNDVGPWTAARRWRHYNLEAARTARSFPEGSRMLLHYEELCHDPQAALDRVAAFVGVDPAPIGGLVGSAQRHVIGNSMRLRALEEIREDRSWEDRLTRADLRTIGRVVGRLSHRFGYPWP